MQEHVNDNVNQHIFFLFIFERRFFSSFFLVCAYVEAWFSIGVVDNTVVQSCLNSWTRHVLFWIFTQRHVFFYSCKDIRQSFSFHIDILNDSSFFLELALKCWCEQPFTFPFILYCLIVSLFCVSFLNFPLFLWIWRCRRPVYWSFEFFFDVSKNCSFLVISL